MDGFTRTLNSGREAILEYKGVFKGSEQMVAVGFNPYFAFILRDEKGSLDLDSLESIIEANNPDRLYQFDEYIEVASVYSSNGNEKVVTFNDTAFAEFTFETDIKNDIEFRLKFLSDYHQTRDWNK